MNILLLNTSFPPELRSAADLFYELGQELVKRGHCVTVVTGFPRVRLDQQSRLDCYGGARFSFREDWNGMHVLRMRAFPYNESSLLARGIDAFLTPLAFFLGCQFVGKQDVSLVYCPPLTLGLTALGLKRQRGVAFLFNAQDIYPQTLIDLGLMKNRLLIRLFEWIERLIYLHADRIIVHSEGNRTYLADKKNVPINKIAVIPNWVDLSVAPSAEKCDSFRKEHELQNKFVVSYAGVMGYAQDLSSLIAAADKLRDNKDLCFLLVGEGVREKEWKEQAAARGLANVKFLPMLSQAAYQTLLRASDAGLVPLSEELRTPAVPGKLARIMGSGRPVIAIVNSSGDASKIIAEARCGYSVSPGDSQHLAEVILALCQDHANARRLGENGRRYAETHFSLASGVSAYECLFQTVTASKSGETKR